MVLLLFYVLKSTKILFFIIAYKFFFISILSLSIISIFFIFFKKHFIKCLNKNATLSKLIFLGRLFLSYKTEKCARLLIRMVILKIEVLYEGKFNNKSITLKIFL